MLVSFIFEVAIFLDIMEGQSKNGQNVIWGKNTEKTGGPKKRQNVMKG